MANYFYNRGANFNPDELADGDAIEAEFDAVSRGFDIIEDLVNANKAGYPTQTFHVAPATEATHALQKAQLDSVLAPKLDAADYNAADVLSKLKTVDGTNSGLDADLLDGQEGSYYRNASNINDGTLAKERLPASIDASTSGNAATASKVSGTAPDGGTADLVSGAMAGNDLFRIRVGGSADAGWVEIATSDGGNEPIYVRQHAGNFASVVRTAALLDGNGNTVFPGHVYAGNGVLRETAVLTGTIGHGGVMPLPAGFSEGQCAFFVSPRDTNNSGWRLSVGNWRQHYRIICYAAGRVAYGYAIVYNDDSDSYEDNWFSSMNYLVIGVK